MFRQLDSHRRLRHSLDSRPRSRLEHRGIAERAGLLSCRDCAAERGEVWRRGGECADGGREEGGAAESHCGIWVCCVVVGGGGEMEGGCQGYFDGVRMGTKKYAIGASGREQLRRM